MMRHSLANYFNQWFQWEVLYIDGSFNACTDVLIIDQTDDDAREKARICLDEGSFVMLTLLAMPSLSLCKSLPADGLKNQVAMARPVGPLKLAKAVVACTDFLTGIKKAEDVPVEALMAQDDLGKKGVESAQSKKTQRVPQDRREDRSVAEWTRTTVQIAKPKGLVVPAQSEALQTERTPRLLLVEDNQVNLKLLKTFMAKQGCKNIRTAENGQIAVEEVMRLAEASRAFDIIFMGKSLHNRRLGKHLLICCFHRYKYACNGRLRGDGRHPKHRAREAWRRQTTTQGRVSIFVHRCPYRTGKRTR